ncbi:MAG: hypothetical protein WAL02_19030, partial [Rhodoplanes sp.]
ESLATAAVAGALFADDDLDMRPISPKASAFAQSMPVEDESSNLYTPAVSIPARSAPPARPRRMPRIDELPIPARTRSAHAADGSIRNRRSAP